MYIYILKWFFSNIFLEKIFLYGRMLRGGAIMNKFELKDFDITVNEVVSCYEDITLDCKWKENLHTTGEYFLLALGIEGKNIITADNKEIVIGKNDIALIPDNTLYSGKSTELPASMMVVRFKATDICGLKEAFFITPVKWEGFEELFFEMRDKFIVEPFGYKVKLKEMVYSVINKVIKELVMETGEEQGYKKIKKSLLYNTY